MGNPQKTQGQWDVLFQQIGTYVRIFNTHTTNITRANSGFDVLSTVSGSNFNSDDDARNRLTELQTFLRTDINNSNSRRSALRNAFINFIRFNIKEFLDSKFTTALLNSYDDFGFNTQTGILKDLQVAMRNNTATSQTVLQNTVSYSIPTSDPSNVITGTTTAMITNITINQITKTQVVTLTCDDETPGQERFSITGYLSSGESVTAQIGTSNHAYRAGLTFKIVRPITRSNDATGSGPLGVGQLANLVTNRGESSRNTDTLNANFIRLHTIIWNNHSGSNEVRMYKASNNIMHTNLATNLVMIGTKTVGTGTFTLKTTNNSGIKGTLFIPTNSSFSADTNIVFDLQRFRKNDKFFVTTTRSVEGLYQAFFVDQLGIALPSSGSQTIAETFAGA
jgi:hypothetical protein